MPITNYETLQEVVARWSGGSSSTEFAEAIRDAISMVEAELDRSLRVPEMIARTRATLNETWEALPSDLVKLISVAVLEGVEPNQTERAIGQISEDMAPAHAYLYRSGRPQKFALNATQIRVLPPATATAPAVLRLLYYARVPRLSADIPCYATLTAYPDLYLFGALSYLGEFVEDGDRLGRFDARFRAGIVAANRAAVTRDATLAA
jgi:hypothetical protein